MPSSLSANDIPSKCMDSRRLFVQRFPFSAPSRSSASSQYAYRSASRCQPSAISSEQPSWSSPAFIHKGKRGLGEEQMSNQASIFPAWKALLFTRAKRTVDWNGSAVASIGCSTDVSACCEWVSKWVFFFFPRHTGSQYVCT